jgi:CO dehydrogenase maturation factor
MSYLIAISGKGGVGKTTVAALIVSRLIAAGRTPVLAVDADPNSCLDEALGVKVATTIGGVREQTRQFAQKGGLDGIAKHDLLRLKINESLVESAAFDLIAMGRPEGPGCYCYANNVLKAAIAELSINYAWVVIDNEAGLENLSRRIVARVNLLVMVADPSHRGLETLRRLHGLSREMEVGYDRLAIAVNRLRDGEMPAAAKSLQKEIGADYLIGLPEDAEVARLAQEGKPLVGLEGACAEKIDWLIGEGLK